MHLVSSGTVPAMLGAPLILGLLAEGSIISLLKFDLFHEQKPKCDSYCKRTHRLDKTVG